MAKFISVSLLLISEFLVKDEKVQLNKFNASPKSKAQSKSEQCMKVLQQHSVKHFKIPVNFDDIICVFMGAY